MILLSMSTTHPLDDLHHPSIYDGGITIIVEGSGALVQSRSWNAGKGDCGHYRSQFCITDTGAVAACRKVVLRASPSYSALFF